jgi:hypothetical protein
MQRTRSRLLLAVALGMLAAGCSQDSTSPTQPRISAKEDTDAGPVTYAVIGDVPYTPTALGQFPRLISAINADAPVERVIHIGDIKSSSTPCSDEWFGFIAADFALFTDPLVYAIGDNEWTDCWKVSTGAYNPLERLAKLRELFFPNPGYTLGGQQVKVKDQKGYPENVRWMAPGVAVGVFHLIGSNNGRDTWFRDRTPPGETAAETAAREAEWAARDAADLKWLDKVFQQAREEHAKGVLLFFQADMWAPEDRALGLAFDAFTGFVRRLSQLATAFGGPVLLVAGDSHNYRVDVGVPWFTQFFDAPAPANVTQLIIDRSIEDDIDYVRLRIDPASPEVFSWQQVFVPLSTP